MEWTDRVSLFLFPFQFSLINLKKYIKVVSSQGYPAALTNAASQIWAGLVPFCEYQAQGFDYSNRYIYPYAIELGTNFYGPVYVNILKSLGVSRIAFIAGPIAEGGGIPPCKINILSA
jgi:hypothetical protein